MMILFLIIAMKYANVNLRLLIINKLFCCIWKLNNYINYSWSCRKIIEGFQIQFPISKIINFEICLYGDD